MNLLPRVIHVYGLIFLFLWFCNLAEGWNCGRSQCSERPSACCGSTCCYEMSCCSPTGQCIDCENDKTPNNYYDDPNGNYGGHFCKNTYCGFSTSGCCGSNCCVQGVDCCDTAGNCVVCASGTNLDDFASVDDENYRNWVCGRGIECYARYNTYQKPNGCCENGCCYGEDYCCSEHGDCIPCPHALASPSRSHAPSAVGLIVGVLLSVCLVCGLSMLGMQFCKPKAADATIVYSGRSNNSFVGTQISMISASESASIDQPISRRSMHRDRMRHFRRVGVAPDYEMPVEAIAVCSNEVVDFTTDTLSTAVAVVSSNSSLNEPVRVPATSNRQRPNSQRSNGSSLPVAVPISV